jgi:hypothetical protein
VNGIEFADRVPHTPDGTPAQTVLYPIFAVALGAGAEREHHRIASALWMACTAYIRDRSDENRQRVVTAFDAHEREQ